MPAEAFFAIAAFGALFGMWVVLPTFLRRRASEREHSKAIVE